MAKKNFLDSDDSLFEKNLKFVKNEVEEEFDQLFGNGNNNSNVTPPPRDYKIVTPKPVLKQTLQPPSKKRRSRLILYHWEEYEIFKLIEAVKNKPELWQLNHEYYKNRIKKKSIWRQIQKNVFNNSIKINDIISKWSNLRVQYKTYAHKYKWKPPATENCKWKFFDALSFIDGNYTDETTLNESDIVPVMLTQNRYTDESTSSCQSAAFVQQTSTSETGTPAPSLKIVNHSNSQNDCSNEEEFDIFGKFVAAEVKRLDNDLQRQQLKRIIQRAIMDFNENIEELKYAPSHN